MKIVAAQCNFTVGNFTGNTEKILDVISNYGNDADLIVFSELAVTGYYPMDLIERSGFVEEQDRHIGMIIECSERFKAAIVIGFIDKNKGIGKDYYNALCVIHKGKVVFRYHKQLLPTYNVFDEMRHFEPGQLPGVFELNNTKIGFLICEDAWNSESEPEYENKPVKELVDADIDLLVSINASPADIQKHSERVKLLTDKAIRYKKPIIYINQVGGNDELIFDGNSFAINPCGEYLQICDPFAEDVQSVDFSDGTLKVNANTEFNNYDQPNTLTCYELIYKQIIMGLRDYTAKCGFKSVVVGSSGGIDSALTIALATAALGAENVKAITMPSHFSSSGSVNDSKDLCDNLDVELFEISIKDAFDLAVDRFTKSYNQKPSKLTKENMQARIRGQILMEYSNHFGSMLLSTGNKSELSVGYATLYGDMNGGLNLLGDLYKMEVYALSEYINHLNGREIIPQEIIEKEPSAELSEGQKDTDSLPPYPVLDAVLRIYIEHEMLTDEELEKERQIIEQAGFDDIERIIRMVDLAEYKRRQAPPIIRVHRKSFGIGRRLPIVQKTPAIDNITQV
ncbi:MAG: NAD+ synthase [Gammaproteobacteria bacterium]|nr:MAG: NAD+ synthase [Gammaproteobacteria bacterium]